MTSSIVICTGNFLFLFCNNHIVNFIMTKQNTIWFWVRGVIQDDRHHPRRIINMQLDKLGFWYTSMIWFCLRKVRKLAPERMNLFLPFFLPLSLPSFFKKGSNFSVSLPPCTRLFILLKAQQTRASKGLF